MKHLLILAILASAILAGCDEVDRQVYNPKPDLPKPDTTRTDTSGSGQNGSDTVSIPPANTPVPLGKVEAPYLVFLIRNYPACDQYLEKYNLDGTARNMYVPGVINPEAPYGFPDLSPRGDKMAMVRQDSIFLMDIETGHKTFITATKKGMGLLTLSRDASTIAYTTWGAEWLEDYYVVKAEANAVPEKVANVPPGDAYGVALSPDGRKLAYDKDDGSIYVSDLNGGNRIRVCGNKGYNYSPIFNKDGDKLIFISGTYNFSDTKLVIAPVKENGLDEAVTILDARVAGLNLSSDFVLSGDGQYIYFVAYAGNVSSVYRIPLTGGSPVKVIPMVGDLKWSIAGMHFVEQ